MDELLFSDGKLLKNCSAGYAGRTVWLTFRGFSLQEAAEIVFDRARLSVIDYRSKGKTIQRYIGFDQVDTIRHEETVVVGEPELVTVRLTGTDISVINHPDEETA